jgi:hypothetical protein
MNQPQGGPQPSRWQVIMPLLLVIYLFMIASVLFGGMFDELDDPHAHSYRPNAPIEQAGQVVALVVTGVLLVAGVWWLRRNPDALTGVARDERMIGIMLFVVMLATVDRCLAALLLVQGVSNPGVVEFNILVIQILASIMLIGGGLSLLLHNMTSDDPPGDAPHDPPGG